MPKPVQVGATALALSKAYALKGKLPLLLDETIVPVHIVGSLGEEVGTPCSATVITAASAGEFSLAGLQNPAGSGVLARVTHLGIGTVGSGGWSLRREDVPFGMVPDSTATGFTRDSRQWDRASTLQVLTLQEVAVLGAGPFFQQADVMEPNPAFDFVLVPGTRLWVRANLVNESVRANWFWTEEPLEPSQT
jgi:hypothetical protein